MKALLAGASGFIGEALVAELTGHGHSVVRLVRREPNDAQETRWDPATGRLDPEIVSGVDAVICLNGVGVGDKRWTESYKKELRTSRLEPIGTLVRAITEHGGPSTFLSASGIGYYGEGGDTELSESAPAGRTFLARLCVDWEAAPQTLAAQGVRLVQLRTGLVLQGGGGLLKKQGLIVKLGAGGRLGSGSQWQSWISLADEVGAIRFALEHPELAGPVNLVGPEPVRQVDFVKTLARQLHRPAVVPTPAFALRLALGEFTEDLLASQRVRPAKLVEHGYHFQHRTLDEALAWAYRSQSR